MARAKWQTREYNMRSQISERVIDFVANVLNLINLGVPQNFLLT